MSKNFVCQPIYIVGPTGSGKSALAMKLARILDGVIISADSMQIYKTLDIGTAKESIENRREIQHEMIDIVPVDSEYSVAEYSIDARRCIKNALDKNKTPIIVGGTGLYFESLFYPMSFGQTNKNEKVRKDLENELKEKGAEYMHKRLEEIDKETADKLHINDTRRVIRALEIAICGGKTKSQMQDERVEPNVIAIGLNTDRAELYRRIDKRVEVMFDEGLVNEVYSVGSFDYQSMKAIGYKEFSSAEPKIVDGNYVLDKETENEIKALIQKNTRNYAKRQLTWFRRYDFVKWFDLYKTDEAIEYILEKIQKQS